jgi:hypothetical protein
MMPPICLAKEPTRSTCWFPVQDWWNATTVGEYWRLWNQPVHKWMLRHVYFPLIRHGVPKFQAGGQRVCVPS